MYSIGADFSSLSERMSKLSSRLHRYGIKTSYYQNPKEFHRKQLSDLRRTYSHTDDDDVVGLDDPISDVAKKLAKGKEKVVLVHGLGGIEKTTFSRKSFHHPPLKNHFEVVAWAYVSQNLQLWSVCREILFQLILDKVEERDIVKGLEDSLLSGKLFEVMKNKKCLVVLDDVWSIGDWNRLVPAFPLKDDSCGSKLLVTVRDPEIISDHGDGSVCKYEVGSG